MLSRAAKAAYYMAAGPLMRASGVLYRTFRAPTTGLQKVHLGPGQRNYIRGWINVDANAFTAKCDVWADLRHPLPFRDSSLDAVYSHHVVEHLPDMAGHLSEVRRCLKPGGIYRIAGPNGDSAIRKFIDGDSAWFGDWPDKRRSMGGRLNNFILCRNEHLAILTESYLRELMEDAGFSQIRTCQVATETGAQELFADCLAFEHETDFTNPHTLVLEGTK
jgi:predicted SAM-dependent methyltransferase